jgi:hypothetical protein
MKAAGHYQKGKPAKATAGEAKSGSPRRNRKQRRELARKIHAEDISLEVLHPDAAGIDIGNESHYVAVPPSRDPEPVRRFGCMTGEVREMVA